MTVKGVSIKSAIPEGWIAVALSSSTMWYVPHSRYICEEEGMSLRPRLEKPLHPAYMASPKRQAAAKVLDITVHADPSLVDHIFELTAVTQHTDHSVQIIALV